MKYICNACKGETPCILDVCANAEIPLTCPWKSNLFRTDDSAEWKELKDSDSFGMRGVCAECLTILEKE